MDILSATIYIILFIVLMIFIFSMGLLTPIIGKKDILSVLAIGFVVGIVGGAFFITPIYEEIPNVVGTVQQTITGENEKINIEVSPIVDIDKLMTDLNKTNGVISIINKGIDVKTDPFSTERKNIIEEKIPIVDKNFENFSVNKSGMISINFTKDYNPSTALKTLSDWLMYSAGINTKYSLIKIQIIAEPSEVDNIVQFLHSENIVVTSIEGPVQNAVNNTKNSMLDNGLVVLIAGIIGIIVALVGIFFDNIFTVIRNFIKKIRKR